MVRGRRGAEEEKDVPDVSDMIARLRKYLFCRLCRFIPYFRYLLCYLPLPYFLSIYVKIGTGYIYIYVLTGETQEHWIKLLQNYSTNVELIGTQGNCLHLGAVKQADDDPRPRKKKRVTRNGI